MMLSKFKLQDDLYEFPYHYLSGVHQGMIYLHQQLNWGLEYMTYMSFITSLVQEKSPQSLLDVGCGDGRLVSLIKPYVPTVWGIDLSERGITFAQAFNPNIKFINGDVGNISQKFAMLALIEVLEHIPDDETHVFVEKLSRCLTSDGTLLISVPTVNMPINPRHYRHYALATLQNELSPIFEIQEHWWLYKLSLPEKIFRRLLHNPIFTLNAISLRKAIWKLHYKMSYEASATNGAHLVCLARLRS